jgi:hypothetical protein
MLCNLCLFPFAVSVDCLVHKYALKIFNCHICFSVAAAVCKCVQTLSNKHMEEE